MATYKTPDVYIEEISVFPPSVAEVETAIPAFIGYTEKADRAGTSLSLTPTRISSMLEFESLFGYGPSVSITEVTLNDNNTFKKADIVSKYFLYDSMRLFYSNGGGDCYIVSVGVYPVVIANGVIDYTELENGLNALRKYDEPTIILFPDAVSLTDVKLYDLQKATLLQCQELKDRVGVFDLKKKKIGVEADAFATVDPVADFRNNVGVSNLKYGMAYTPWLNITLKKNVTYPDLKPVIKKSGSVISLKTFTTNPEILALIDNYDALSVDIGTEEGGLNTLFGTKSFRQKFEGILSAYELDKTEVNVEAAVELLYKVANRIDSWTTFTNTALKTDIINDIGPKWVPAVLPLVKLEIEAGTDVPTYTAHYEDLTFNHANWGDTFDDTVTTASAVIPNAGDPGVTLLKQLDAMMVVIKSAFEALNTYFLQVLTKISEQAATYESSLLDSYPLYKSLVNGVNDSSTIIPPSGAVVGCYAAVDRDRGVWKAPANISLNSVVNPTDIYTATQLEQLNIDVNGGKSINAIRAFTGKGTLIWGARTLAGNDNEWRYIPVRRFYNMVEESIKKSTYWAVFEPNNANTWVKVKGMIDNYLTNKWKDGALVGAKPDDAFFVRIGLGTTMSAQDILEGRMHIEIGMAVVRPAEFIILKFSHLLQKS
jgi:phage tail sheath protein FI